MKTIDKIKVLWEWFLWGIAMLMLAPVLLMAWILFKCLGGPKK